MNDVTTPYYDLKPDTVMDAIESTGRVCDYRIIALNSYENRVYQIGIEDSTPIIAKFYRPGRWTKEQIIEEHTFTNELADADIPVATCITSDQGDVLFEHQGFLFSLFTRVGGYPPEIDNLDTLYRLGQYMGRIHSVGHAGAFNHRVSLNMRTMAHDNIKLLSTSFVPNELLPAYSTLCSDILNILDTKEDAFNACTQLRLHGDCHPSNILWRDDRPTFVDFDDAVNGPALQDIWMWLSGDRFAQAAQLSEIVEGYEMFASFPTSELPLIETLRTMRIINYSAWLAKRWEDPAFKMNFPWFNSTRYWSDHILALREQLSALQEEPIALQ